MFKLQPQPNQLSQPFLRYATWNKEGNSIVYVYDNNIYFRSTPGYTDGDAQLTNDGALEEIFNGVPDWVYEGARFRELARNVSV